MSLYKGYQKASDIEDPQISDNAQRVLRARNKTYEPGLVSLIAHRGSGLEPLFVQDDDYLIMLGLLRESAEKFSISYYALSLLPNQILLLMRPGEKNLVQATRWLFSRYAAGFNQKYQRRGHLFGGPYRQSVCLDDTYLLAVSVYVHASPVCAGLVNSPNSYKWSSSSLYCNSRSKKSFVDTGPVLRLVDADQAAARKKYGLILRKALGARPDHVLEQNGAVEEFCIRLADIFPDLFTGISKRAIEDGEQKASFLELARLERMLKKMSKTSAQSRESREVREYVVQQLLARGFKKTEIAERLGISLRSVFYILSSKSKKLSGSKPISRDIEPKTVNQ